MEFGVPDEQAAPVLRVTPPLGMTAVYLVHGGVVLELMEFAAPGAQAAGRERVMNEPGLTHISLAVADFDGVLARVPEYGGEVLWDTKNDMVAFIRDPDGQLLELGTIGRSGHRIGYRSCSTASPACSWSITCKRRAALLGLTSKTQQARRTSGFRPDFGHLVVVSRAASR